MDRYDFRRRKKISYYSDCIEKGVKYLLICGKYDNEFIPRKQNNITAKQSPETIAETFVGFQPKYLDYF